MISAPPLEILSAIEAHLPHRVVEFSAIGGGCINYAGRIGVGNSNYFVKWNDRAKYPSMLSAEASALQLLRDTKTLHIPEVVLQQDTESFQFLLLEFIESRSRTPEYWSVFGEQLARLHHHSTQQFGLQDNNYIGSLRQINVWSGNWIAFFINNRLDIQLKTAVDDGYFTSKVVRKFARLYQKLSELLPIEKPALLHGDLWSGNLIIDHSGQPCLIDPAVYYGHREVDLAMTTLFGGFDHQFLNAYNSQYPLIVGYEQRFDIYNLYPLLVHVNLFGGNYVNEVVSILDRFV